jgi:hypothetical protein
MQLDNSTESDNAEGLTEENQPTTQATDAIEDSDAILIGPQEPRAGDEEKKTGGLWQGLFGFVNVMVGGGCLVLPWVIGQCGIVLGFAMIILMASASLYTQRLLCFASMHYFKRRMRSLAMICLFASFLYSLLTG